VNASEPLAAVVLAAGASSRMGAHKMLLQLDGESLIRRVVRTVREVPVADVVVVTGYNHRAVEKELSEIPVRFTLNENYREGMGSSFAAGVRALDARVGAALFVLGDRPFVTSGDYRRLIEAYRDGGSKLVASRYGDVIAPPHVVARSLFARVANDGVGIRPLLDELGGEATLIDFPEGALLDVDEPADLEHARALLRDVPAR
jgi:molybdenum cofactor cytidylyltransferase